ncbi:hypothetical protein [Blastococcus goldschmidtiae]|uniref:Lipoprotein n=1 Tax=Blastococcus goldschmidtiae TaxID=3075546 RepID=A0ABU2K9I2_9ACTN|nr:hypothetical protein [Blastococcus sp. DSM 46792]MDT0276833.1 hypothetical protein [Blastococcus sp. DSM 46792]
MRRSVLPAFALALTLTACGFSGAADGDAAGPEPAGPSASDAPAEPGTEEREAELNERGNVLMGIGEEAPIRPSLDPDEPPVLTLSVEEVIVDPVCEEDFEEPPENGHYVAFRLSAESTPTFDPRVITTIADYDFRVIGPDGSTYDPVTPEARGCFGPPLQIRNMRIGADHEYRGWMVVDVPVTSGSLVYAPGDGPNGWEWQF